MIIFNCDGCGQRIRVSEKYAGKKGKCPKCKEPIVVPLGGEKPAEEPSIIKFRCPSCNQKIGVTLDYAGKRVRCSKCKKPLVVPEGPSQAGQVILEDETNVLRAGHEERSADEGAWDDMGGLEELRLAEENAPLVEREVEPEGAIYESGDGERAGNRPRKKRLSIIIGAVCLLVLLAVVIGIWSGGSEPGSSEREMSAELNDVEKFAEDYIGLLSDGKIDEARELLSSESKIDVQMDEIKRISDQIGKSIIIKLDHRMTHVEKKAGGDQIFLWYGLEHRDSKQSVIISILALDEGLRVDGIAAKEPLGDTVFIGKNSYEELSGMIIAGKAEKFGPIIVKFLRVFVIVGAILGLIQTISMWIIFDKAGQPGWAAIVPVYNMWVLAEVAEKPGWLGLVYCFGGVIPIIGPIVVLILWVVISIGVARAFGRGIGFGIGLTIMPFVFYPILAFSND